MVPGKDLNRFITKSSCGSAAGCSLCVLACVRFHLNEVDGEEGVSGGEIGREGKRGKNWSSFPSTFF